MVGNGYTHEVTSYIIRNLKKGYTKESLKWALIGQGHSKLEIDKAFEKAEKELALSAPVLKTKPIIKHEIIEQEFDSSNIEVEPKKKSFWRNFFE